MISVRKLSFQEVCQRLRELKCKPLDGKTSLNTAHWWCYPWGGAPFTVPYEDPYTIVDYDRLFLSIIKAAPPDYVWESLMTRTVTDGGHLKPAVSGTG